MRALVLAAGKSTRIASVAGSKPKPLLEIAGLPILAHNLRLLARHGITDVFVNLHHQPEQIREAIGDGSRWGVQVRYSHEPEILGTAGAVKKLEPELSGGTFLVLYGDNYTDCDLTGLTRAHRQFGTVATLVVFDLTKSDNSGIAGGKIVADAAGHVKRFAEGAEAKRADTPWVNAGIYALEPRIFSHIAPGFSDFGKDVFPSLVSQEIPLSTYPTSGFVLAADTPEALRRAQEAARLRIKAEQRST